MFDYFHYGHLKLLENCKKLGDYLIVAVHDDKHVKINKPACNLYYNENIRLEMVKSIKYVDEAILYTQIDETIKHICVDILVVGPDQVNSHFMRAIEYCLSKGIEVITMPRTPDISSTAIKTKKYDKKN